MYFRSEQCELLTKLGVHFHDAFTVMLQTQDEADQLVRLLTETGLAKLGKSVFVCAVGVYMVVWLPPTEEGTDAGKLPND